MAPEPDPSSTEDRSAVASNTTYTRIPEAVQQAFNIRVQTSAAVGGGFSGAKIYRVDTIDGRQLAVRQTPATAALPSVRRRALHLLLGRIAGSGLTQVPVPMWPGIETNIFSPSLPVSGLAGI